MNHFCILFRIILSFMYYLMSFNDNNLLVPNSHHNFTLYISLPIFLEEKCLDISHNFRKVNYFCIRKFLSSFDWPNTFRHLDLETAVNTFYDTLHFFVFNFVLKSCFRLSKFPLWFSLELKI